MIPHNTVIPFLAAPADTRAPADCIGVYATLFAHHADPAILKAITATKVDTFPDFLSMLDDMDGLFHRWKGGEVKPANLYYNRLGTLSSEVNTSSGGKVPTADKFHDIVTELGGFVLVMMVPVSGFHCEKLMMAALVEKYDMSFDNFRRIKKGEKQSRIKKDWLPSSSVSFTI